MKIEVMSRAELKKRARRPFTEPTAVISIRDSDAPKVALQCQPAYICHLVFDDITLIRKSIRILPGARLM